jgi:hypothetical protein
VVVTAKFGQYTYPNIHRGRSNSADRLETDKTDSVRAKTPALKDVHRWQSRQTDMRQVGPAY